MDRLSQDDRLKSFKKQNGRSYLVRNPKTIRLQIHVIMLLGELVSGEAVCSFCLPSQQGSRKRILSLYPVLDWKPIL